jgi:DNA-binding CsgD family transcriptional regulator
MPILASALTILIPLTSNFDPSYSWVNVFIILLMTAACAFCSILCFELISNMEQLLDSLIAIALCYAWFLPLSLLHQVIPSGFFQEVFMASLPLSIFLILRETNDSPSLPKKLDTSLCTKPAFIRLLLIALASGLVNTETQVAVNLSGTFAPLVTDIVGISIKLLSVAVAVQIVFEENYPKVALFSVSYLLYFIFYCFGWIVVRLFPSLPNEMLIFSVCAICLGIILSYLIRPLLSMTGRLEQQSLDDEVENLSERYGLTQREAEMLSALLQGKNVPMIKKVFKISEGTARTHINRIYRKLDVHSRQELFEKLNRL